MSQVYHYFHGKCSDVLHTLVLAVQTFPTRAYHTIYTVLNHPYSHHNAFVNKKFLRNATLWNKLPTECFDTVLTSSSLESTVDYPIYPLLHLLLSLTSIQPPHSVTLYPEWLLGRLLSDHLF